VIQDLLQILSIFVSVVNRDGDAFGAESARTADSVKIVFSVAYSLVARAGILCRHIEVDHDLNLWDVNASR